MLNAIFQSFRKTWKLRSISKRLSYNPNPQKVMEEAMKGLSQKSKKDEALEKLIDLAYSDDVVRYYIEFYKIERANIREIYQLLIQNGAGQYAGGHFVAASSLVYGPPAAYLFAHFAKDHFSIDGLDEHNSGLRIAYRLIEYFENNEMGEV